MEFQFFKKPREEVFDTPRGGVVHTMEGQLHYNSQKLAAANCPSPGGVVHINRANAGTNIHFHVLYSQL
jgi:hypothetical protein